MQVNVGMPRLELEERLAILLGRKNMYNLYNNNLSGGTVSYHSVDCELEVTFASGSPAPLLIVASGANEHLPPKDETVLSHRIIFASSKLQN